MSEEPRTLLDVGLGTAYERLAIYRLLDRWASGSDVRTAREGPVDGMAGIPGLHLVGLARRGVRVRVESREARVLETVRAVYARLGAQAQLEASLAASDAPSEAGPVDLALSYNAVQAVGDWRSHLAQVARGARYLALFLSNPLSYGVQLRRAQRALAGDRSVLLFDHPATRRRAIQEFLGGLGRIVHREYVDCPWWPDFLMPFSRSFQEDLMARLPPFAARLLARERGAEAAPLRHGPDRFPYFSGEPGFDELSARLARHPAFDGRGPALGLVFGHLQAFLVEMGR